MMEELLVEMEHLMVVSLSGLVVRLSSDELNFPAALQYDECCCYCYSMQKVVDDDDDC